MVSECTAICILFFSKISLGSPPDPNFNQPYCSTAAYIAPRLVYDPVPSVSGFSFLIYRWQCAFLAQFYKRYSLVWVSLKGLIFDLHSWLHSFASFFQNFLGGGGGDPPNPHLQEGRPLPYPPPLGPSVLEKTPPGWLLDLYSGACKNFPISHIICNDRRRNPITSWLWGQRQWSTLAFCLLNFVEVIQTTVYALSSFTNRLIIIRVGTLLNLDNRFHRLR